MPNTPIREQDELLLNALLDGELSEAEEAALRERMEREPALRKAHDTLVRMNGALSARAQSLPTIDWQRFHANVMNAVEAEAQPKPLRFPTWLRIGLPVGAAIAAAVALMVSLAPWNAGTHPVNDPVATNPPPTQIDNHMATHDPRPSPLQRPNEAGPDRTPEPRLMLVRVERPGRSARPQGGTLQVSFDRSRELAEVTEWREKQLKERPQWHMFVADRPAVARAEMPFDLPL